MVGVFLLGSDAPQETKSPVERRRSVRCRGALAGAASAFERRNQDAAAAPQCRQSGIETVIQRLRDNGYLDDARFARSFVTSRIENRLEGRSRVRRDLAARRVRPDLADEAVRLGYDGIEEAKLLRQYLQRKLRITPPLDPTTALGAGKPAALQSLYRRLLRAGFRSDTIVGELKRLLHTSSRRESDEETASLDEVVESISEEDE